MTLGKMVVAGWWFWGGGTWATGVIWGPSQLFYNTGGTISGLDDSSGLLGWEPVSAEDDEHF